MSSLIKKSVVSSPKFSRSAGLSTPLVGTGIDPTSIYGDWLIERQSLQFSYWRAAKGRPFGYNSDIYPEEITVSPATIDYTDLFIFVHAAVYMAEKFTGYFSTETHEELQEFEVLSQSQDLDGTHYDTIPDKGLGPQGLIVTDKPWYSRRRWDPSTDSEVVDSATGASNFLVLSQPCCPVIQQGSYQDNLLIHTDNQSQAIGQSLDEYFSRPCGAIVSKGLGNVIVSYDSTPNVDYTPIDRVSLKYRPENFEGAPHTMMIIDKVGARVAWNVVPRHMPLAPYPMTQCNGLSIEDCNFNQRRVDSMNSYSIGRHGGLV